MSKNFVKSPGAGAFVQIFMTDKSWGRGQTLTFAQGKIKVPACSPAGEGGGGGGRDGGFH